MSNISSLSDLRKKEEEKKSTGDEYYAGGVDNRGGGSGMAVVGPNDGRRPGGAGAGGGDVFDSIVARAQQPADGAVPATSSGSRRITLYRNGFIVDDGPLRDLTSPESRLFISTLEQGRVPAELRDGMTPDQSLDVQLSDNRGEDYIPPPPPAYVAFSGPATTLRGASDSNSGSSGTGVFSIDSLSSVEVAAVDDSKPTTLLQVRSAQGKKIRLKINQDASVLQLAAMIVRDGGADGATSFTLSAGFPPQDVQDGSLTIKDAGLVGAAVTVKVP